MRSPPLLLLASISGAPAAGACRTRCVGGIGAVAVRGGASRVELSQQVDGDDDAAAAVSCLNQQSSPASHHHVVRRKKRRSTRKRSSTTASSTYLQSSVPKTHLTTAAQLKEQDTPNDAKQSSRSSGRNSCMAPFMASATPWVRQYLESTPNDVLLPVPREFLSDGFNLQGLQNMVERAGKAGIRRHQLDTTSTCSVSSPPDSSVSQAGTEEKKAATGPTFPLYRAALRMMLSEDETTLYQANNGGNGERSQQQQEGINAAAVALYSLVHARFAVSPRGLDTLRRILRRSIMVPVEPVFGRCPRVSCDGMPLLPVGLSDEYDVEGSNKAMRYCPSCGEILHHFESQVDGSAWGTSLCHLFLMTYGGCIFPEFEEQLLGSAAGNNVPLYDTDDATSSSIGGMRPLPQIFGFPVHETQARIKYPLLKYRKLIQ